jgi:hypothetical protein
MVVDQSVPVEQKNPPGMAFSSRADHLRGGRYDAPVWSHQRQNTVWSQDLECRLDLRGAHFAIRAEREDDEVRQVAGAVLEQCETLTHLPADHAIGLKALARQERHGVREHRIPDRQGRPSRDRAVSGPSTVLFATSCVGARRGQEQGEE